MDRQQTGAEGKREFLFGIVAGGPRKRLRVAGRPARERKRGEEGAGLLGGGEPLIGSLTQGWLRAVELSRVAELSAATSKPATRGHFKTSHFEGGLVIGLVEV